MASFFIILDQIIRLYMWAIILAALLSVLISLNILNYQQQLVYLVSRFLFAVTEPVLGRVRRFLPIFGGVDLSPLFVLFGLQLLRLLFREYGLI